MLPISAADGEAMQKAGQAAAMLPRLRQTMNPARAARYDAGRRQAAQLRSWTRWARRGAAMKRHSLSRQRLHHHAGAPDAPHDAIPVGNCSYSRA